MQRFDRATATLAFGAYLIKYRHFAMAYLSSQVELTNIRSLYQRRTPCELTLRLPCASADRSSFS